MPNNLQILDNVERHAKISSKSNVRENKVLNLGHLDFDIVSDFVLRISYFSYQNTLQGSRNHPLHLSRELYKSHLFMQNKAKLQNDDMNATTYITKVYDNLLTFCRRKNKAKQSQFTKCQKERKPFYDNLL